MEIIFCMNFWLFQKNFKGLEKNWACFNLIQQIFIEYWHYELHTKSLSVQ